MDQETIAIVLMWVVLALNMFFAILTFRKYRQADKDLEEARGILNSLRPAKLHTERSAPLGAGSFVPPGVYKPKVITPEREYLIEERLRRERDEQDPIFL